MSCVSPKGGCLESIKKMKKFSICRSFCSSFIFSCFGHWGCTGRWPNWFEAPFPILNYNKREYRGVIQRNSLFSILIGKTDQSKAGFNLAPAHSTTLRLVFIQDSTLHTPKMVLNTRIGLFSSLARSWKILLLNLVVLSTYVRSFALIDNELVGDPVVGLRLLRTLKNVEMLGQLLVVGGLWRDDG